MERSHQQRQFLVILMVVFLGFIGISMPYLLFPSLFLNPDYSILPEEAGESLKALLLGVTLAAYPLGQFIGSPILGSLSDGYGRKPLLSWSLLVAALCHLLTGLAIEWQHIGLLVLSRFAAGSMEGNVAIARAMAVDMKALSKHETLGKINATTSAGFLLGPLFGAVMADKSLLAGLTVSTPFYSTCVLFLCLALLSAGVLHASASSAGLEKRSFWQRVNLFKRMAALFGNRRLRFLLLTSTCFTLAVDIFYEFGPVYLTEKWMLEPTGLILYNAVVCVALVIGNGWLPRFCSARLPDRLAILSSIGAFVFILVGISIVDGAIPMTLLFFSSGLAIGVVVTLVTVQISDAAADDIQGEVMGVQLSLRVFGDGMICLLGSTLLILSPALTLIVAAAVCLAALMYYFRGLQEAQRSEIF